MSPPVRWQLFAATASYEALSVQLLHSHEDAARGQFIRGRSGDPRPAGCGGAAKNRRLLRIWNQPGTAAFLTRRIFVRGCRSLDRANRIVVSPPRAGTHAKR